jgi:mRNA interferase RelE/StbE
MYQLKYRKQARNYLARLPLKIKATIINRLHQIAADPDAAKSDIKVLKGREGYRLRIGQYRVIYTRHDAYFVIEVVKVRPRGDIYKG